MRFTAQWPTVVENGRRVEKRSNEAIVDDDDFGYDAMLKITGDFVDDEALRYAQAVADALNAADIPRRK